MADDEHSFVSRRGKRVSLSSLNVEDLHIEDIPGEQPDHITTPRSAPPREPLHIPWRWMLPIFLLMLALPVVAGEYITRQYATSGEVTGRQFNDMVNKAVMPLQPKDDLTAAKITELTNSIDDLSSRMCKGGLLDNTATLYPRASEAHKQCINQQEKYSSLIDSLRSYTSERDYLEHLQAVLKPLSEPIPDRFAVIGSQLELWRTAEGSMKQLSPPASLKAIHDSTYKHTYAIMQDWSKLNTSYNEKDGVEFAAIQKRMKEDYSNLQANANKLNAAINLSQTKITNAYSAINQ